MLQLDTPISRREQELSIINGLASTVGARHINDLKIMVSNFLVQFVFGVITRGTTSSGGSLVPIPEQISIMMEI
jgi:hypothetical protein